MRREGSPQHAWHPTVRRPICGRCMSAPALHFVDYVGRVQAHQWQAPTPCADWDVRTLVDHVVRWNTLVPDFLAGQSMDDMVAPMARDVLGDDPARSGGGIRPSRRGRVCRRRRAGDDPAPSAGRDPGQRDAVQPRVRQHDSRVGPRAGAGHRRSDGPRNGEPAVRGLRNTTRPDPSFGRLRS